MAARSGSARSALFYVVSTAWMLVVLCTIVAGVLSRKPTMNVCAACSGVFPLSLVTVVVSSLPISTIGTIGGIITASLLLVYLFGWPQKRVSNVENKAEN